MCTITTTMSMLAIMMGTMAATLATAIDYWVGELCRGMLVAVSSRDTFAVQGIPAGTGGGDHSSPLHATDRRGDAGDGCRGGTSRTDRRGYRGGEHEDWRSSSEPE